MKYYLRFHIVLKNGVVLTHSGERKSEESCVTTKQYHMQKFAEKKNSGVAPVMDLGGFMVDVGRVDAFEVSVQPAMNPHQTLTWTTKGGTNDF